MSKTKEQIIEQSSGIAAVGVPEYDFKYDLRETNPIKEALKEAVIPESGDKYTIITSAANAIMFISRIQHGFSTDKRSDLIDDDIGDAQYHFNRMITELQQLGFAVSPPPQAESDTWDGKFTQDEIQEAARMAANDMLKKVLQCFRQDPMQGKSDVFKEIKGLKP